MANNGETGAAAAIWPHSGGDMASRIRDHDWHNSPIGGPSAWSAELLAIIDHMLGLPMIASVAVGPQRVLVYNDAAAAHYGGNHPVVLGQPLPVAFPDQFRRVANYYDRAFAGESIYVAAQPLDPSGSGRDEVIDAYLSPVRDATGSIVAVHMVGFETGSRLAAEERLRESEERQRFKLALSDRMRSETDAVAIIAVAARMLREKLGASRVVFAEIDEEAGIVRMRMAWSADGVTPPPATLKLVDFAGPLLADLQAGHTVRFDDIGEPPYSRTDLAAIAAIDVRAGLSVPLIAGGRFVVNLNVHQNVPRHWTDAEVALTEAVAERLWDALERARAEQALRASEERLNMLVEGVPQLVWRAIDIGNWTWASSQWTRFTGQTVAECQGWGWLDPVHPDDRERALAQWQLAPSQGRYEAEYRIRDAATGDYHWFQTRAAPVRDVNGRIIEWLGTSTDIHDLRQLQERQQLLVAELQHRVRNILTVVRSVFARTVETGRSIEEIADHFKGRLDAMARTQAVVTQTASGTVDLENLIRDELLSVGITDGVRLSISGPDLPLPASVAESIGLAIHELTTNAVKYGALRESGGQVDIHWEINLVEQGQRRLTLIWREQGVPAVGMKPAHHGFGRELIERALPYRLGAETQLEFRGGGVRCSISLLLPDDGQVAQIEWGR